VIVIVVARRWETIDGDERRWKTINVMATAAAVEAVAAVGKVAAAVATAVTRLKRFEIQTHCFSTLDKICWVAF